MANGDLPPSLGGVFVVWAETWLVHGEGDLLGRPYKCPEWGVKAAYRIFEYDPDRTLEVGSVTAHPYIVQRALMICPKGSAKTEFVAALMLFLLAGPSLPTPAGPVMRRSPNIPVAAGSWDQADKLYGDAAKNMAQGTPDSPAPLAEFVECFDAEIQLREGGGKLYRVAAVAGTNDGGLPTAGAADEIHEWTGKKRRVHLVLFQGMEKRANGLEINITTPDDADPDSLLGEMAAYGAKVADGEVVDSSFYFLHYGTAADRPITDEAGKMDRDLLLAALDDATPTSWRSLEDRADTIIKKGFPIHEVRRYWLGAFARRAGHWLPEQTWENRGQDCPPPAPGSKVVLGFDGSYNRDSTALVGCTLEGHIFVVDVWERPEAAGPDWRVPRAEVMAVVAESMERYEVVELAPDPFGWVAEIEEWERTYGDVVVTFPTNQVKRFAAACSRFYAAVAGGDTADADMDLSHDNDPRLSRHLRNATVRKTLGGEVVDKPKGSPLCIDAADAAIVAFDRAGWHVANPAVVSDFAVVYR